MSTCCQQPSKLPNEQLATLKEAASRLDEAARTFETTAKVYGRDRDRQEDAKLYMRLAQRQANSYIALRQLIETLSPNPEGSEQCEPSN